MALHRKSRVSPPGTAMVSKTRTGNSAGTREPSDILYQAQQHWLAMDRFRRDRARCKRYAFGDQWGDVIEIDGERMTEEQYLRREGNIPLKNNLILRMLHSLLGVYRSQNKEPVCTARDRDEQQYGETMSTVLQYNMQINRLSEINALSLEEFLISGFTVQRKWYGWRDGRKDCWTDLVQPDNFFIDSRMRDPRGTDCTLVGEIHDVDFDTLAARLASSPGDFARLREIYAHAADRTALASWHSDFGHPVDGCQDFYVPRDPTVCRVIEIWRKEITPRYRCWDHNTGELFKCDPPELKGIVTDENARRMAEAARLGIAEDDVPLIEAEWMMDDHWRRYLLSPLGDILEEGDSPYDHGSHPYVFKAYPFIDGEVHSYVSNIIDQQKYINRLISMYDMIMRSSAKGTLLVPEGSQPTIQSMEDFVNEWSKSNGVVFYRPEPRTGAAPHQLTGNNTTIGIDGLLNIQMKFFEDISGVNGALQGRPGLSGMSAALYSQQTQNATISLLHVLESFDSFVEDGALKDVKLIQQYYDIPRYIAIAGRSAEMSKGDISKISDVEFDLSVTQSTSTPAYRAIANDMLLQLWQAKAIETEDLLECGDFPFSDALLQSLRARAERQQATAESAAPSMSVEAAPEGVPGLDEGVEEQQ